MMTEIIGYWFAAEPCLPNGDGRPVVIGETLTVEPPIICCERGLHGSEHPFDALEYAPGPLLYRCRYGGVFDRDRRNDKLAASERTPIAMIDATELLRSFARKQALSVIHLWDAPPVVRQYLDTGDDETLRAAARATALAATVAAARAAASYAARAAAWAAASDAVAAWAAASYAARAASRAAASDAVAAWVAASYAAWAAAWGAVWDATLDSTRAEFLAMVEERMP